MADGYKISSNFSSVKFEMDDKVCLVGVSNDGLFEIELKHKTHFEKFDISTETLHKKLAHINADAIKNLFKHDAVIGKTATKKTKRLHIMRPRKSLQMFASNQK